MKPEDKNPEIRKFQSTLMGVDVPDSIQRDRCVSCGGPAMVFNDAVSLKEFGISGLCQACQDEVFGMLGDEDDL